MARKEVVKEENIAKEDADLEGDFEVDDLFGDLDSTS